MANKLNLLLCHDNRDYTDTYQEMFKRQRISVQVCNTARGALYKARD